MRLLFVHNLPFWDPRAGGGQRINHELAVQAALRGHDVTVLHLDAAGASAPAPELPYRVIEVSEAPRLLTNALRVARRVRRNAGIDVVYASAAEGGLIPSLLPAETGLLATTQHPDPPPLPAVRKRSPLRTLSALRRHQQGLLEANLLRHAHAVTVPSEWSRRTIRERGYVAPDHPVAVLPNGVGAIWFDPPPEPPSVRSDLLLVGRMDRQKGVDVLLRAMARSELTGVTECLVGAGPSLGEFRAEGEGLGLAGRLEFLGHRSHEQVRSDMAGASAFVLPSRAESFGMAVLEAMAAGLPVVTTPAGGIAEFARDGVNALVVPVDDPAALARAIRTVLDNPELARRLSTEGRRTAERFRWNLIGELLEGQLNLAHDLAQPNARPPVRRLGQAYRKATAAWAAARAQRPTGSREPAERVSRIAITRFGLTGDLLLVDPLLNALEQRFPEAMIELITSGSVGVPPWMKVSTRLTITRVHARSDPDRWARPGHPELRADLVSLAQRWKGHPPDLVLFSDPLDGPVMSYLAAELSRRAPRAWRSGLIEGPGRRPFLDRLITVTPDTHEIDRLLRLAAAAGAQSRFRLPRVPRFAPRSLPAHDGPDLAVHAGGSRPQKLWHAESFAQLIERVHEHTGARVILVGNREEGSVQELIDHRVPVVDLTGATTLEELASVLASTTAFVGNDSFPFHLATALGTPSVVLSGPSSARWTEYPSRLVRVVREPILCSPRSGEECPIYTACKHAACMKGIRVESVLEAVLAALAMGRPRDTD